MLIAAHLDHLTLAGYRPRTIAERRKILRHLARFLAPVPIEQATRHQLQAFLARPLAPESRRAYRGHLTGFYEWLCAEGAVAVSPAEGLPTIRVPRAVPRPVPEADVTLALRLAPPRMHAWLLLMALAGLRACEVSGLRPEDLLVLDGNALLFIREGKGGAQSTVPAHTLIVDALAHLPQSGGRWWTCSASQVSREVSLYLTSVGVRATGHQLRHSAATSWYRASGHDLLTTSRLLRHQSVSSTQVYAQIDPTRPAEVVRRVTLA